MPRYSFVMPEKPVINATKIGTIYVGNKTGNVYVEKTPNNVNLVPDRTYTEKKPISEPQYVACYLAGISRTCAERKMDYAYKKSHLDQFLAKLRRRANAPYINSADPSKEALVPIAIILYGFTTQKVRIVCEPFDSTKIAFSENMLLDALGDAFIFHLKENYTTKMDRDIALNSFISNVKRDFDVWCAAVTTRNKYAYLNDGHGELVPLNYD